MCDQKNKINMSQTTWVLDPAHSEINFKVKHLMITNVSGSFSKYDVAAVTEGDDFSTAKISFNAETASVTTHNEQRDGHLKGAEFFDVEKYPVMTFTGTKYVPVDKNGNYELLGDLTIKSITKPVTLSVEFGGVAKDPWGNAKAGFSINGKFNRKDWGLNWNAALEAGGVLVSDEVRINSEIQLVKKA